MNGRLRHDPPRKIDIEGPWAKKRQDILLTRALISRECLGFKISNSNPLAGNSA